MKKLRLLRLLLASKRRALKTLLRGGQLKLKQAFTRWKTSRLN